MFCVSCFVGFFHVFRFRNEFHLRHKRRTHKFITYTYQNHSNFFNRFELINDDRCIYIPIIISKLNVIQRYNDWKSEFYGKEGEFNRIKNEKKARFQSVHQFLGCISFWFVCFDQIIKINHNILHLMPIQMNEWNISLSATRFSLFHSA